MCRGTFVEITGSVSNFLVTVPYVTAAAA